MGAPKGLYELEQLILDLTHASRWTGDLYERDVPYYDKFPLNTRVTYPLLLDANRSRSTCRSGIRLILRWCGFRRGKRFAHITRTRLKRSFILLSLDAAVCATRME